MWVPKVTESLNILELEAVVENLYNEIQVGPSSAVAYKGGHYERST